MCTGNSSFTPKNATHLKFNRNSWLYFRTILKDMWKHCWRGFINPLSPSIHIQILQTDLHTSPVRISWENLIKDHGIFPMMIILLILITLSLDSVWILVGENCCWSLLGLKGSKECKEKNGSYSKFSSSSPSSLFISLIQEAETLLQEERKLMERVDTDVDYNMEGI